MIFTLVGTKSDLRDDEETLEKLKQNKEKPITKMQGEALAKKLGENQTFNVPFIECSAVNSDNIDLVFQESIRMVLCPPQKEKTRNRDKFKGFFGRGNTTYF